MNKKANTVIFMLAATLFNIIFAVLTFFLLMVLYLRVIGPRVGEPVHGWAFSFIFILSLVISFLVYRGLFKFLLSKFDPEKYFDPIIKSRYKK